MKGEGRLLIVYDRKLSIIDLALICFFALASMAGISCTRPASAFLAACASGDKASVAAMLMANPSLAKYEDKGNKDRTALNTAVEYGQIEIVKVLVQKGAPIDGTGRGQKRSPLIIAATLGNSGIVQFLINQGANVNAVFGVDGAGILDCCVCGFNIKPFTQSDYREKHKSGTKQDYIDTLNLLIKAGADVNAQDIISGYSALQNAAINGNLEFAQLLLSNGANVNIKDKSGFTPLADAMVLGKGQDSEITQLLVSYGGTK